MLHILALLPAVYLIIFVYRHDKVEKEPISLLLKLLFFGALSMVPTVIVGTILELLLGILLPIDSAVYNFFYMFISNGFYGLVKYWLDNMDKMNKNELIGLCYIFVKRVLLLDKPDINAKDIST